MGHSKEVVLRFTENIFLYVFPYLHFSVQYFAALYNISSASWKMKPPMPKINLK